MSEKELVEIELDLPIETIEWLNNHAKFLGITLDELVENILEEGLLNETTKKTNESKVNTPT